MPMVTQNGSRKTVVCPLWDDSCGILLMLFHIMPSGKICCLKRSHPPHPPLNSLIVFLRILWTPAWAWVSTVLCMSKCSLDWSLYSSHPFWSRRWTLIDYWPFRFWACPRESLLSLCMSVNWRTLSTKGKQGIRSIGSLQNRGVPLSLKRCHFSNKLFQIKFIFISKSPLGVSRSYKRIKIYSDVFVYYKIRNIYI